MIRMYSDLAAELRAQAAAFEAFGETVWIMRAVVLADAADVLDAVAPIMALDWPCDNPGCFRGTMVPELTTCSAGCVDGQVPLDARIRKLLAVWQFVSDTPYIEHPPELDHVSEAFDAGVDTSLEAARQIGRDA